MPENKNLDFWKSVEKTNPAHTKSLSFGRKITTIDPYQQVKNVTEEFGIAGIGWGWEVRETHFLPTKQVAVLIRCWVKNPTNYIEQWGQTSLYKDKKQTQPNDDCLKVATTDGLTKCFSYFGFNADVFLGKFDDNKYVQMLKQEFEENQKNTDDYHKSDSDHFQHFKDCYECINKLDPKNDQLENLKKVVDSKQVSKKDFGQWNDWFNKQLGEFLKPLVTDSEIKEAKSASQKLKLLKSKK